MLGLGARKWWENREPPIFECPKIPSVGFLFFLSLRFCALTATRLGQLRNSSCRSHFVTRKKTQIYITDLNNWEAFCFSWRNKNEREASILTSYRIAFMDPERIIGSNYVKRIKVKFFLISQVFTSCFCRQSSGSVCRNKITNL